MEKIILDYPDYAVHPDGYVLSTKNGSRYRMVGGKTPGGYPNVTIRQGGIQVQRLVHRLVAAAFVPNPLDLPEVNHIDGDKSNNACGNLEWCDRSHNMKHAYAMGNWGNQHTRRAGV